VHFKLPKVVHIKLPLTIAIIHITVNCSATNCYWLPGVPSFKMTLSFSSSTNLETACLESLSLVHYICLSPRTKDRLLLPSLILIVLPNSSLLNVIKLFNFVIIRNGRTVFSSSNLLAILAIVIYINIYYNIYSVSNVRTHEEIMK